jgi:hypothetical protein
MEQEKEFTSQESLALIARMITKAKKDYYDTGLSSLLWGSVITLCGLTTFVNHWLGYPALGYIWFLTVFAVAPQVIIAVRESRSRKRRSYEDDLMGGIWISFGIAIFLLSYVVNVYPTSQPTALFLTLYGVPTFGTGYARQFRPMLLGGIACWVLAIVSLFLAFPYTVLCITAAAQLAWFIPGLILRKRYLKAKKGNV